MAQWRALLNLEAESKSRVSRLYHERRVPLEIRRYLSDWIEAQDWDSAAGDETTARTCFQVLLLELDKLIRESLYNNHTLEGPDFSLLKDHLMNHFERHPVEMAERLSGCLKEERQILESCAAEQSHSSSSSSERASADLDNKVDSLEKQTKKIEEEIKALEEEESIYKTWESEVKRLNGLADHRLHLQCLNQEKSIRTKKQGLVDELKRTLDLAAQVVQALVSVELPEWKRKQQMSCIGNPVSTSLDQLELWFSSVGEVLLQIVRQLKKLQANDTFDSSDGVRDISVCTKALLGSLLRNALVVEKQPVMLSQPHRPLVLRTNVLFTVKLRLLANLPTLKDGCLIRAEFDKNVDEVNAIKGFRQFQFTTKSSKQMNADAESGRLEADWGMEIAEMKAKRKRSNVTPIRVTEELHVIHFSTDVRVEAGLQCHVETWSLPLVIVSTTSQAPSAWASVMWYNLLSVTQATSLSVFMNPPPLSWGQLSRALSWQFISAGDRELNQDQLDELKVKVTDDPDELVLWSRFSDHKGPWLWIDGILDLIKKHLKELWRDGSIVGFVSKKKARVLLQSRMSGTFLLRFSETNREGAVSFSLVEHRGPETNVHDIDPFTKDELSRMSLADHIERYREKGRSPLVYLYPDIPKDTAFRRYYTTTENPPPPYVRRKYICEGDCPTPPSPPPHHTGMDLDPDLMDIPTSQLLQSESPEDDDLMSSLHFYDSHKDYMDVSKGF